MDRAHPMPVRYLAGVPRFLYGAAAHGLTRVAKSRLGSATQATLSDELKGWDLAGYFWGRHIYTLARFSPVRSRRNCRKTSPQLTDGAELDRTPDTWNPSCYLDSRHGIEGPGDRDPACRLCMAEHRRASAPTV